MSEHAKNGGKLMTIIIVIVLLIVVPLIFGYIYVKTQTNKIKANWPNYRCSPWVLPFAGMVGPSGTSTPENASACISTMAINLFNTLMQPFIKIFDTIFDILKELVESAQNTRKMMFYLRSSLDNIASDVYGRIKNAYYRIAYLFKTIQRLIYKIFTVFKNLFKVLEYSYFTMSSLWHGPIGGMFRFFCFKHDTPIKMSDGSLKPICKVVVGDVLQSGAKVLGTMEFESQFVKMYNYKNIVVSGNHCVYENGKYIRVGESVTAKPYDGKMDQPIYCLHTSDSHIIVGETVFLDYYETNDPNIHKMILNYTLSMLNKKMPPIIEVNKTFVCGFTGDTIVGKKPICKLMVGDKIDELDYVTGIIKTEVSNNIYRDCNGITCTGAQIARLDKYTWMPVCKTDGWTPVNVDSPVEIYHITTMSGVFKVKGKMFRDFNQVDDGGFIDDVMLNHLNGSVKNR